ncbi:MAG TPA: LysM peptidoglycan-binding domain-containing protein [Polyangiaceae bacterium]|nr:LysM peptidoglycan-binding domain-containing protein [Polyangiaceae bacterium]
MPHSANATTVKSSSQGKDGSLRRRAAFTQRPSFTQRASSGESEQRAQRSKAKEGTTESSKESRRTASDTLRTHRVKPGETLDGIALHYDTSAALLASANGLKDNDVIRSGQVLVVVHESEALPARSESNSAASSSGGVTIATAAVPPRVDRNASWARYVKAPKTRGWVDLSTTMARFSGATLDRHGRLEPEAVRALNNLLNAGGAHPRVPERLLYLLVRVSDTFGGRPIRIVSGYRTSSYYEDSRHKHAAAVDFSITGVPNAVVRDFIREFDDVGVGFYPNSSFVHLDVRTQAAYWVDYAGPGEPPRSTPDAPTRLPRSGARKLLAELDGLFEHATKTMERIRAKPSRDTSGELARGSESERDQPERDTTSL